MRLSFVAVTLASLLETLTGCSSEAIDGTGAAGSAATGGGSTATGGAAGVDPTPSMCSAALKQSLSLVDEVSTARVSVVSENDDERTLFIDASVGGLNGQDTHPWVYIALDTGQAVAVTDLEALSSTAWDLAFKRSVVRTNGGDSGPGMGGAIRIALGWDKVTRATLGNKALPTEAWFDADCMLSLDAAQNLITTFSGWSEYDEANHVLSAADVVFITAAADGSLYKVAILDYYGTPTGGHGSVAGRYQVRVAPLP
jgi:hypothetical protein